MPTLATTVNLQPPSSAARSRSQNAQRCILGRILGLKPSRTEHSISRTLNTNGFQFGFDFQASTSGRRCFFWNSKCRNPAAYAFFLISKRQNPAAGAFWGFQNVRTQPRTLFFLISKRQNLAANAFLDFQMSKPSRRRFFLDCQASPSGRMRFFWIPNYQNPAAGALF